MYVYKCLRGVVQETWDSITHAAIQELIREIPERLIEVVLTNAGHTKY